MEEPEPITAEAELMQVRQREAVLALCQEVTQVLWRALQIVIVRQIKTIRVRQRQAAVQQPIARTAALQPIARTAALPTVQIAVEILQMKQQIAAPRPILPQVITIP